jgi:hypothetical protein
LHHRRDGLLWHRQSERLHPTSSAGPESVSGQSAAGAVSSPQVVRL